MLFADDTTFQISGRDVNFLLKRANCELEKARNWFAANKLTLAASKTKYILFKNKSTHVHLDQIYIDGSPIDRVGENFKEKSFKFLGHVLDENLTWLHHQNHISKKLVQAKFALSRCKNKLPPDILKKIYISLFESHLHFGASIWGAAKPSILENIVKLQKKAIRHISNSKYNSHTSLYFKTLNLLKFKDIIKYHQCSFIRQYKNNLLPSSFVGMFSDVTSANMRTRDDDYNIVLPNINLPYLSNFPTVQLIKTWNSLPITIKSESKLSTFQNCLKSHMTSLYMTDCILLNCRSCAPFL